MNKNFQESLNNVTVIQRQAVEWEEGPLLVIAGPGSGKTRVLTLRIARLLENSSEENYRILGLTFTNKAADEMRARIEELVPGMNKRLFLGTFHSFCMQVLRDHGAQVGVNPDFTIYSDVKDLNEIIKEIIEDLEMKNVIKYIKNTNLLPIIQYLQRNLIEPNEYLSSLKSDNESRIAIEEIYRRYWDKLQKLNALDFDSLVFKTYLLFKKYPFIANHYRKIYKYICIDEFQDTNLAQYQMIKQLTRDKSKNIFVVADDNQLIYQWNGASDKRLNEFKDEYGANVIQLVDNFRCPPEVVQLANNLISFNKGRLNNKNLFQVVKKTKQNPDVLRVKRLISFDEEVKWIVKDIKYRKVDLNSSESFAIIARTNKLLSAVYEALKENKIPVVISKRKNSFESPVLSWMHSILHLANKRNDIKYLSESVSSFEFFTQKSIDKEEIVAWSESRDGDYLNGFYNCISMYNIDLNFLNSFKLDLVEGKNFMSFIEKTIEWLDNEVTSLEEQHEKIYMEERVVLKEIINGFYYKYGNDNSVTLSMFLQELDLAAKQIEPNTECVQCLTIHSAKGKEFEHVYLLGLVEDELPSFWSRNKGENSLEMEEERRNCFVAITRTNETLTLTFAENYNGWSKTPSRFLYEMGVLD
ncbi:hypothetical protein CN606_17785 [Bacillus toyonensis]|uniref:ATP-dependent helicase n=1 Tax=Bacillus toyonensis TaxID=155322 RepID=UPI000BEF2AF0|nr:ATP-dependent helicase [Bacillus toyonensis]PEL01345.1 hypothetical protein CN606_17785 [Bacillus toyonensis]